MLVKQAAKSLGEADKKEIIKKLNTTAQSGTEISTEPTEEPAEPEQNPEDSDGEPVQESLVTTMSGNNKKNREDKVSRSQVTRSSRPYKTKF